MTRLLSKLGVSRHPRWWPKAARCRGDAATSRLRSAHLVFDDSVVALRKAALDHVDCQDLASTALRANLDRLARRVEVTR